MIDHIPPFKQVPESCPENVESHFYVQEGMCLCCRLPEQEAPDLMGFHAAPDDCSSHCYFKKQPLFDSEVQQALLAMQACCCGALRYAGHEPTVLQALELAGLNQQCDNVVSKEGQ